MIDPSADPTLRDNFYLMGRGRGPSQALRGKVHVFTVYLRRSIFSWRRRSKRAYERAMRQAIVNLEYEAKRYGVDLSMVGLYTERKIKLRADPSDEFKLISRSFSASSVQELQERYEEKYDKDETILLLAFDRPGRSFARFQTQDRGKPADEISVICFDRRETAESMGHTIAHEILHQFGARDFYFPPAIKCTASDILGDSIMNSGRKWRVDDLTACVIGWQDTVGDEGERFLRATNWMTKEIHVEEQKKDRAKNGFAFKKRV
jgi:hypothetical protein